MIKTGVLAEPDFRRLLAADLVSMTGSSMVPVALSFALAGRGAGAGAIGSVLFAETMPMALLLLLGGVVADRLSPRPVMVAADAVCFLAQAVLAVLLFTGRAPLVAIIPLSALIGVGAAFAMPGRSALLVRIVAGEQLQSANALLTMASSISSLIGPGVGGLLVASVGPESAVGIDALSYLVSAVLLLRLRLRIPPPERQEESSVAASFAAGWTEFRRHRWIWLLAAQASLVFLLSWGPFTVLGALTYAALPHGSVQWGGLLSILGAGVGIGALLGARLRPERPILFCLLGFLIYPVVPFGIALHWPFAVQACCMLVAGTGFGLYNVLWETSVQRTIPPDLLSRVSSFDQFSSFCMMPLGFVVAAPLSDWLGTDRALILGGVITVLCITLCLGLRDIRNAARTR